MRIVGSLSLSILMPFLFGVASVEVARATVVLNQIGNPASYEFNGGLDSSPSQIFTDFPSFDSGVLEDFAVTSDQLELASVSVLFHSQGGFRSFDDVDGYQLNIFSDVDLAGASLFGDITHLLVLTGSGASVSQIIDSGSGNEYGLVTLDVDISLPSAGTYWVGVSPKSALSATGQFLIPFGGATGSVTGGNADARLANPSEGFGLGSLSTLNEDYAYSVTTVPEPGYLPFLLIGGSALCLHRRRTGTSS